MTSPAGLYKGSCSVRASSEATHVGGWVMGARLAGPRRELQRGRSRGGAGLCRELAPQVRGALLHRSSARPPRSSRRRPRAGAAASLSSRSLEAGGARASRRRRTVTPGASGSIARSGPARRQIFACLFAGLLLYREPDATHSPPSFPPAFPPAGFLPPLGRGRAPRSAPARSSPESTQHPIAEGRHRRRPLIVRALQDIELLGQHATVPRLAPRIARITCSSRK